MSFVFMQHPVYYGHYYPHYPPYPYYPPVYYRPRLVRHVHKRAQINHRQQIRAKVVHYQDGWKIVALAPGFQHRHVAFMIIEHTSDSGQQEHALLVEAQRIERFQGPHGIERHCFTAKAKIPLNGRAVKGTLVVESIPESPELIGIRVKRDSDVECQPDK